MNSWFSIYMYIEAKWLSMCMCMDIDFPHLCPPKRPGNRDIPVVGSMPSTQNLASKYCSALKRTRCPRRNGLFQVWSRKNGTLSA